MTIVVGGRKKVNDSLMPCVKKTFFKQMVSNSNVNRAELDQTLHFGLQCLQMSFLRNAILPEIQP